MRDSRPDYIWQDPTLDPVELERKLLAETMTGTSEKPRMDPGDWTPLRRLAVTLCVALVAVYLVVWAVSVQDSGGPEGYVRSTDFVSVLTGAVMIREGNGRQLYDLEAQRAAQSALVAAPPNLTRFVPFDQMPFEAIVMALVMGMPPWFAFALWTMATGLTIGLAVGLLDGALPVPRPVGWVLSLAACSFLPVMRSLMLGQDTPFVLLGLCGVYSALKREYEVWAGLSLLLVALRPSLLPAVLIVLLLQGYVRTLAVFAGSMLALAVLSMPLLGINWIGRYLGFLFSPASTTPGEQTPAHSWLGFANEVLGSWSPVLVPVVFVLLAAASAAVLVWARRRAAEIETAEEPTAAPFSDPGFSFDYEPGWDLLWALGGLIAVLASPRPAEDDLALLVFPAWIIGAYATSRLWTASISRLWVATLSVGYILAPLAAYAALDSGANKMNAVLVLYVPILCLALVLLAWQLATPPPAAGYT